MARDRSVQQSCCCTTVQPTAGAPAEHPAAALRSLQLTACAAGAKKERTCHAAAAGRQPPAGSRPEGAPRAPLRAACRPEPSCLRAADTRGKNVQQL